MSSPITVMVLVEGRTEHIFVKDLLARELGKKMVFLHPIIISKKGENGGDVKFERVQRDINALLRQRADTYITTFIDYYGVKEWPGVKEASQETVPSKIADYVHNATLDQIRNDEQFSDKLQACKRFIPYMAVHEFEALLFSDSAILASMLGRSVKEIDAVLAECGEPEAINNSPQTAPSKRLAEWNGGRFPKTTLGISIAQKIGIPKMREKCPLFNQWLARLESLATG